MDCRAAAPSPPTSNHERLPSTPPQEVVAERPAAPRVRVLLHEEQPAPTAGVRRDGNARLPGDCSKGAGMYGLLSTPPP